MTRSFRNRAQAAALAAGLAVALAPGSAMGAPSAPTKQIGPGPLKKLLVTDSEVMAALPNNSPTQMQFDFCFNATASGGSPAHSVCTEHNESAPDPTKPRAGKIDVLSFSSKAAARAGLAAARKSLAKQSYQEFSNVTKDSFTVVTDNPNTHVLDTKYAKTKGSNLVIANCGGPDRPTQLACARALTAAQLNKLPK